MPVVLDDEAHRVTGVTGGVQHRDAQACYLDDFAIAEWRRLPAMLLHTGPHGRPGAPVQPKDAAGVVEVPMGHKDERDTGQFGQTTGVLFVLGRTGVDDDAFVMPGLVRR